MKNGNKNVFDTFLEKYDEYASKRSVEIEEYYRPSKLKCIFGFGFSLVFFIIMLGLFNFSIIYFVILIGTILCLLYYGLNLFTEKGFVVKKKYSVPEEYLKNDEDDDYNNLEIDNYNEDIDDEEDN